MRINIFKGENSGGEEPAGEERNRYVPSAIRRIANASAGVAADVSSEVHVSWSIVLLAIALDTIVGDDARSSS